MGADDEHLVAGDFQPFFIHRNEPVSVTVKGQPQRRTACQDFFPEALRVLSAALVIDIDAVRLVVDYL